VKDIQLFRELDLRYVGQGYELTVPFTSDFLEMFFSLHEKTYGHAPTHLPIEIVNLRVRAVGSVPRPELKSSSLMGEEPQGARIDHRRVILGNARVDHILFYRGSALLPGNRLRGPSVIAYKDTTVYLPESSAARVDGFGNLIIEVDA
jgi:N-methylhydantoinase A